MMPENAGDRRAAWPTVTENEQRLGLGEIVSAAQHSFWTILGCVLVMMLAAAAYLAISPPSYVASAQLLIGPPKQQFSLQDNSMLDLTIDSAAVESQVEVLRSEGIANKVIAALGLANDPEFQSDDAGSEYVRQRTALMRFRDALSARRIGASYVIEISFRSTDPHKAALITNAITAAYFHDEFEAKAARSRQASHWMEEYVAKLGAELNTAASAAQRFRRENGITDNNNNQPRLIDKLTELEARAEAYRKLYESFLQRLTGGQEQETYPVSNARVITAASAPLAKTYPRAKLVILLSVALGLIAGAVIAVARMYLDDSARSARDIERATGLRSLASLPYLRPGNPGGSAALYETALDTWSSPFIDAVRSIKISLESSRRSKNALHLGLLALQPGEGTSTLAVGLAAALGASGCRTLLVDANPRQPSVSRWLAPGAPRTAIGAICDKPEEAVIFVPKLATHVLPLAIGSYSRRSTDFVDFAKMRQLFARLDPLFDSSSSTFRHPSARSMRAQPRRCSMAAFSWRHMAAHRSMRSGTPLAFSGPTGSACWGRSSTKSRREYLRCSASISSTCVVPSIRQAIWAA